MSNFEGATLVPWQVCKSALDGYDKKRIEMMESIKEIKFELNGMIIPFLMEEDPCSVAIRDLTNNGKRDAYLNPEQAAFVNRWSNA